MDEKKVSKPKVQNLILENREKLNITGVIDVESFNDESVIVDTELGLLIVRGRICTSTSSTLTARSSV